ncbi:hypothetical protein KL86PLE_100430 [uncultured Pleomorphomonas sp.]|uniref:Uncharacterized protein n=1 Tax=uncultured Pleomorphomonas sp. TaxID=442121 RepID=A0A212L3A9_9HYPH|nr:hypothetical protein KL86PLE_100430 [uncultured Pleomorphomonas sp.]
MRESKPSARKAGEFSGRMDKAEAYLGPRADRPHLGGATGPSMKPRPLSRGLSREPA